MRQLILTGLKALEDAREARSVPGTSTGHGVSGAPGASIRTAVACWFILLVPYVGQAQTPPFGGTIFLDPDIIVPSDRTTFVKLKYAGQEFRTMYDRRVGAFISVNAYLFDAEFDDGLTAEIQVNPEFGNKKKAQVPAKKYAEVLGRLPTQLRTDMDTVWIHMGDEALGGGNNNVLIHTDRAVIRESEGILEETLVHEASHTSLDAYHAAASGWLKAQGLDGNFISTYARDNPDREDVAETFLTYLAVRYRPDRISPALLETISNTVPNRIEYFDDQPLLMYPLVPNPPPSLNKAAPRGATGAILKWKLDRKNSSATSYEIQMRADGGAWQDLATLDIRKKKLIVSALESGRTYAFRVRANGPHGPSGWSNERAVTLPG